jgi:hypothetical protein
MENSPKLSEPQIIDQGIALFIETLPSNWTVTRLQDDKDDTNRADAILSLGPSNQGLVRVVIEAKTSFTPKDVDAAVGRARLLQRVAGELPILVMAPWLSERSRQMLIQAGLNYLDLEGNMRLSSTYPPLFIYRDPAAKPPKSAQSTLSLKGRKAGRLVRLMVDVAPPYSVLELAKAADVTAGYISRLLEKLDREAIVERNARGGVERVNWRELLKRRAEVYGVFTSNAVERFVCPNGPAYALELAGDLPDADLALSGSFAAERVLSVAPPALLVLYVRMPPARLIQAAGLVPAREGANVVLATPYDPIVMELRWPGTQAIPSRVQVVAASQIALDCLTGNGRMPQEGEAFMEWMALNEDQWRFPALAKMNSTRR